MALSSVKLKSTLKIAIRNESPFLLDVKAISTSQLMLRLQTQFDLTIKCGWFSGIYLFRGVIEYVIHVSFYRRNHQYKKHKTWDGDAIFVVNSKSEALLYDCDGKLYAFSD